MVRRNSSRLKKTSKLWIFCEGKTERRYFENLRVIKRARIKIIPKEAGVTRADQILKKAIKFREGKFIMGDDRFDKKRDRIACVFDKDDNNTSCVFDEIRSIRGKIVLGYTNPAFEYWILCHHGFYDSNSYNQKEVYVLVKNKLGIDTKKEKELYDKTKDKIENAKNCAKRIRKIHERKGIELISRDSTPLSLIYVIIELIDQFK
ncbi:MAG: RloB domain-containing protein [Candidatus Aenigmarchaeota archaeon]|nr:RloB domain-containing protein [Candidatus Aenigmarchaeota archaeon]